MQPILLDTDILIDAALDRKPFAASALRLLDVLEKRPGHAYLAWHSISNFYYMVKPIKGGPLAKDFIRDLLRFVKIASTNHKDILYALRLPLNDFEDSLQCACAIAAGAEVIATRNIKDYRRSPIPAQYPDTILKAWEKRSLV